MKLQVSRTQLQRIVSRQVEVITRLINGSQVLEFVLTLIWAAFAFEKGKIILHCIL